MGRRLTFWATVVVCLSCGDSSGPVEQISPPAPPPPQPPPPAAPAWKAFDFDDLANQRAAQNLTWMEFLSEASLRMGLYHLPTGANDGQGAHSEDEIYYVARGAATLFAGGSNYEAQEGSAFYVRAGIDHRFHTITEDLSVLVVFRSGPAGGGGPDVLAFDPSDQVKLRDPASNVWDPFLGVPTMSLGMYMLPAGLGGDGCSPMTSTRSTW